jgi:hypothetical protein
MSQEPSERLPVPPSGESDAPLAASPQRAPWYQTRAALVFGAWVVAQLAAGIRVLALGPMAIMCFFFFPFGLVRILGLQPPDLAPNGWSSPKPGDSLSEPVFWAASVVYILLTVSLFLVPRGRAFRALYAVLLVVLALNVVGCQMMTAGFK